MKFPPSSLQLIACHEFLKMKPSIVNSQLTTNQKACPQRSTYRQLTTTPESGTLYNQIHNFIHRSCQVDSEVDKLLIGRAVLTFWNSANSKKLHFQPLKRLFLLLCVSCTANRQHQQVLHSHMPLATSSKHQFSTHGNPVILLTLRELALRFQNQQAILKHF